jgi:hypothetical protein
VPDGETVATLEEAETAAKISRAEQNQTTVAE